MSNFKELETLFKKYKEIPSSFKKSLIGIIEKIIKKNYMKAQRDALETISLTANKCLDELNNLTEQMEKSTLKKIRTIKIDGFRNIYEGSTISFNNSHRVRRGKVLLIHPRRRTMKVECNDIILTIKKEEVVAV